MAPFNQSKTTTLMGLLPLCFTQNKKNNVNTVKKKKPTTTLISYTHKRPTKSDKQNHLRSWPKKKKNYLRYSTSKYDYYGKIYNKKQRASNHFNAEYWMGLNLICCYFSFHCFHPNNKRQCVKYTILKSLTPECNKQIPGTPNLHRRWEIQRFTSVGALVLITPPTSSHHLHTPHYSCVLFSAHTVSFLFLS